MDQSTLLGRDARQGLPTDAEDAEVRGVAQVGLAAAAAARTVETADNN
jgi:hypothetical protein